MVSNFIQGYAKCIPLFILITFLSFPSLVWSSGENTGQITIVKGEATCTRPGVAVARKLAAGSVIQVADTLETDSDSRLQLLLSDDSVINMSGGTVLRISQYSFDPAKSRRTAVVSIKKGTARFILHEQRKDNSRFRIETGQALIDVSIADMLVEVAGQQTKIVTFSGSVVARNNYKLAIGYARVGENSYSIVRDKTPPSIPVLISPQQRRRYIKDVDLF